ncbi:MAG: 50S ribosomal protein L15 [Elusimicrobiaceae bacterium]|nr:50S ribosomal protein L15 [Elusimicrobiaceae bacterium]
MVTLNKLFPKHGSRKPRKRLGLGAASGLGNYCGKGMKGQTSRSGNTRKESKAGGQMPLVRQTPKSGFSNKDFARRFDYVNVGTLEKLFKAGAEVTPEALKKAGAIHDQTSVKILGMGELSKALKVSAHGFSKTAKAAIEKAGGNVTVLEKKTK